MKRYLVNFECLLPIKIDTVIEADGEEELISKLENRDITEFHYKTIGEFRDIREVKFIEIKE